MNYYPPLAQLIGQEALPSDVGLLGEIGQSIQDVLDELLQGIRFKDLVVNQSAFGDVRFFSLTIVAKEIGFKLPGTDISFLVFPGADGSGLANIPIAFDWRWGVKRYAGDFESALFSRSPRDFFDLLLKVANITEVQFISGIVDTFVVDPDPYLKLVQDIRASVADYQNGVFSLDDTDGALLANAGGVLSGLDTLIANLQDPAATFDSDLDFIGDSLLDLANTLDIDLNVCLLAFQTISRNVLGVDDKLERLRVLFNSWFGGFDWDHVEELLIPQFSLSVTQIPLALEFPRKWLVPLDANGESKPDPATSKLTFNAGSVTYSTRTGLTFDGENSFGFDKSAIGKTGLTLEIDDAKVDFSRTTNIPEADAAGYPVDFVGVFVHYIAIGLPKKWFEAVTSSTSDPMTLGVVGRDLLIGTGGITGTIGLEALAAGAPLSTKTPPAPQKELQFVLGKQPPSGPRKGFLLGFSAFDMTFRHNAVTKCKIAGSLTIPKSDPPTKIGIELFIGDEGDFEVTASDSAGFPIEIPGVFIFHATSVSIGKKDDKIFLSLTGDLDFSNNSILSGLITKPIHLEKLLIHSDGSFEIEGGTVPLPESVAIKIGPAKIAITALHMGAHEQEHGGVLRKYRYIGFDGGLSLNPGGIDARGDGITFYHTIDDDASAGLAPHRYLGIKGIGLDLVIPGSASKESAALLLHGYLALKDPVYQGSISFELPKAKIFGGASMMYDTSYPAWIVRADLELPKALPLGSTSLGIYSFSGLFGLRYVASKEAINPPLAPDASWGDYYRAPQPQRGVWPEKFMTPQQTGGSKNPFSVGVGVGLCTVADGGKTFSSQLFLLVSLPNLIMLEGRADILAKKRVGPNDDPPYYAYLAISPESVELGAGVHYLIPKDTGAVLKLDAVFEAAFFFHNSSAWYVHFGTKAKPVTARILSMFDGYSYLMLSAAGIEAGAGVHYDFDKSYGPIGVSAHAYLDLWAHVSFERFQAGGGIALGGSVDVRLFRFELYIELAAGLTVEVPKPFRVAGSVEICVTVKLIKTFSKCCTLEFVWDRDQSVDTSAVNVIAPPADSPSAIAVHMLSGSTYAVEFSDNATSASPPAIPLDCYIDVKLTKPVDPSAVTGVIGGITNPPSGNVESLPPAYGTHVVTHQYTLTGVKIEILAGSGWLPYLPYKALAPGAVIDAQTAAQLATLPLGTWQKQDMGYSQIRFLALTPFSWMGPMSGYVPEEMGLTAKSIYCVGRERDEQCLQWQTPAALTTGINYTGTGILYRVDDADVAAVATTHDRLSPVSLAIAQRGSATFRFLQPTVHCRIAAFTTAPSIVVHWQRRSSPQPATIADDGTPLPWPELVFEDVGAPLVISRAALANDIVYDDPANPIERVVVETPGPDPQVLASLAEQIAQATEDLARADARGRPPIQAKIARLVESLQSERDKFCIHDPDPGAAMRAAEIAKLQAQLDVLEGQIAAGQANFAKFCKAPTMSLQDCAQLSSDIEALQKQEKNLHEQVSKLQSELESLQSEIVAKQQSYGTSCAIGAAGGGAVPSVPVPGVPAAPAEVGADRGTPSRVAPLEGPAANGPSVPVTLAPAPTLGGQAAMSADDCVKLAGQIAALQAQAKDLASRIAELQRQNGAAVLPADWPCGTFLHEICWLTETDYAYNQTIPGIAAIAADYAAMRAATEGVIQPIWQPRQTYRIALSVRDRVTDVFNSASVDHDLGPYYVHFRTEGPIGFFDSISSPDFGIPANPSDDDRVEAPERAIKFYVDEERSYPDPSGNLLYAKPLYYASVALRLFFNRPYAYHFFADWTDVGGGARTYALDLAVKDPAEAAPAVLPPPPDYEAAHVSAALTGTQDWIGDSSPMISQEIATIRAIQNPLAPGETHSTACLVSGGEPIVPLSKSLKVTVHDLEPDKLYTAVVLNKDVVQGKTAEVGSYPFKTSHYRDFAEHIASLRLRDDDGNARLAVFEVDHVLAPAAGEAAAVSAALAIVTRAPGPASAAYPDAFDRLIHEQLKLDPLAPPVSLEINFVSNSETGRVYGLWIRSPEALFDPRLPAGETAGLMQLLVAGSLRNDARFLFSKDACQAFAMSDGTTLPLQGVSFAFANKIWNGLGYDIESAVSETFGRP